MIIVVADDISGAAEVAAAAMQYGLTAQVQTRFCPTAPADLIAVDTDSRSLPVSEASDRVAKLSRRLDTRETDWCFKKVDSVLRGHVHAECTALMNGLHRRQILLVPANPSKGRTIVQGQYRIHGQPLHESDFANDPEYPAQTSSVIALSGGPAGLAAVTDRSFPADTVIIGNVQCRDDVMHWARSCEKTQLPAGGVDFFQALLGLQLGVPSPPVRPALANPSGATFYMCGSGSSTSRRAVAQAGQRGISVHPMPAALYHRTDNPDENLLDRWAADIVATLNRQGCAMAAITQPVVQDGCVAVYLRTQMAALARQVMDQTCVNEWVIEGGATARAVLDRLDWHTLDVRGDYGPGIVQMQVHGASGLNVTLKPGSYPWPENLWKTRR